MTTSMFEMNHTTHAHEREPVEGEMRPGKQGIAFRAAFLPDILKALQSLQWEGSE